MKKQTINYYNHRNTLAVVSLYPKRGEVYSAGTTGVASYVKNVITHVGRPTVVFANIVDKPEAYEEGNTLVIRCFRAGSFTQWKDILVAMRKFPAIKTVLLQHDFGMYGPPLVAGQIILFLLALKAMGIRTTVTLHHVITDIFKLYGHVGIGTGPLDRAKGHYYNLAFRTFNRLIGMIADTLVVLEEPLKAKLARFVPEEKIVIIPHGVDAQIQPGDKVKARRKLGIKQKDFIIMFFGFANWFKGADIFARNFAGVSRLLGKPTHFIMAGGLSPTMKDKWHYQKYFQNIQNTVANTPNITITGYIPQKKLNAYFTAADLVVLPYRHFMTASGVLSLVFSYKKPFIVSKELSEMFDAPDFRNALKDTGLTKAEISFNLTRQSMIGTARGVLVNGRKAKMARMAETLRRERSYVKTGRLYEDTVFARSFGLIPALAKSVKF